MKRRTPSNLDGERVSKALNILLGIINNTDNYTNLVTYMRNEMNLNIHPRINDITSEDSNERVKHIFKCILHKSTEDKYMTLKKPLVIGIKPATIMYTSIAAIMPEPTGNKELDYSLDINEVIILLFVFLFAAGFNKYHLRYCRNEKCNKIFYQFKTSGQQFCSPKCR